MEEPHSLMKNTKHLLVNQYNDLKNIGEEFISGALKVELIKMAGDTKQIFSTIFC